MKTHCSIVQMGLCLSVALTFGTGIESVLAQPNVRGFKSFADWCENKEQLTPEARHTVEVLLEEAGTQECEKADETLTNLTGLSLSGNQIADVQPLSTLANLRGLDLSGNQIADVQPLSALTNLTRLDLGGNQIEDVQPLSALTNLTWLDLRGNPLPDRTCPLQPESICQF